MSPNPLLDHLGIRDSLCLLQAFYLVLYIGWATDQPGLSGAQTMGCVGSCPGSCGTLYIWGSTPLMTPLTCKSLWLMTLPIIGFCQRKATSTQGSCFRVWTYRLLDTATTLPEKQLLACYWVLVKTELLTHGTLVTPLPDISIWVYINLDSTNKMGRPRQLCVVNGIFKTQLASKASWLYKNKW